MLSVELDEEWALDATRLVATGFGGWVTIFQPPLPLDDDLEEISGFASGWIATDWQVLQWREVPDGGQTDRARAAIALKDILDVVPGRFHDWVMGTTEEALRTLEELVPQLGSPDGDLLIDDGAAMLAGISTLRSQLAEGRERSNELRRRRERFYGQLHLYDFAPDAELYWRLDLAADGVEALIVRPAEESDDRSARAFLPPDEVTEWRWTKPESPDDGGKYLTPSEVLARIPPQFHGWVAARTHEALQRTRHTLHEMAGHTLMDHEDLARMSKLAQHARGLIGGSQAWGGPNAASEIDESPIAEARSPEGRLVLLFASAWQHIVDGHPEVEHHLDTVVETLRQPEHREPDSRVGRERFFRRGGPEGWMRVVVQTDGLIDRVVTAFPQVNPPERWRSR